MWWMSLRNYLAVFNFWEPGHAGCWLMAWLLGVRVGKRLEPSDGLGVYRVYWWLSLNKVDVREGEERVGVRGSTWVMEIKREAQAVAREMKYDPRGKAVAREMIETPVRGQLLLCGCHWGDKVPEFISAQDPVLSSFLHFLICPKWMLFHHCSALSSLPLFFTDVSIWHR